MRLVQVDRYYSNSESIFKRQRPLQRKTTFSLHDLAGELVDRQASVSTSTAKAKMNQSTARPLKAS